MLKISYCKDKLSSSKEPKPVHTFCNLPLLQACSHDSDCGKERGKSQQEAFKVGQNEQCSQGLCVTLQFSTEAAACGEVQSSQGVGCYTFLLQRKLRMQLLIVLYAELTDPSRLPSKAWQRLLLKPVSPPLTSQKTRIDSLITMQDAGCAPIPALRSTGSSSCL